ncbi:NADH dehydrogenase [ubiquinone] iron-sulfur protein 5-A, partial [Linum grandiflorum]
VLLARRRYIGPFRVHLSDLDYWLAHIHRRRKEGSFFTSTGQLCVRFIVLSAHVHRREEMASGWGITGNKGRCYDFWIDFSECMSKCREPKDCAFLREDYMECLHHSKEFQRRNRIYKEEQRKIRAAARLAKEGAGGGGEKVSQHA